MIIKTIPVTIYNKLLTFRVADKIFELHGNFLKSITTENYNVDLAILPDKKLLNVFAKEMEYDKKVRGNESNTVKFYQIT